MARGALDPQRLRSEAYGACHVIFNGEGKVMNYATERLLAAAKAMNEELGQWGSDTLETMNLTKVLEELESALFYFDAHGDKPAAESFGKTEWLALQSAVSNSDIEPEEFRQRLLDKIGTRT
jgi:hypothetical protein